jgi:transcriptional regulator with XRE-family HTH domain
MEDKRAMNLVQSVIKAKMRQGMTQADIARECKVTEKTVWNALYDIHTPHVKLLTALKIKRDIVYTLISPKDERELLAEPGVPMTGSARKLRKMRREAEKELPSLEHARTLEVAPIAKAVERDMVESLLAPKLTAARVYVALQYGLKAGNAWVSFLKTGVQVTDAAWLNYCASIGNQQPALAAPREDGALGAPGELYAHLKPVVRGADMRPVDPFGVKFVDAK